MLLKNEHLGRNFSNGFTYNQIYRTLCKQLSNCRLIIDKHSTSVKPDVLKHPFIAQCNILDNNLRQ